MKSSPYITLLERAGSEEDLSWLVPLLHECERLLETGSHGDLPAWRSALAELPDTPAFLDGHGAAPRLGGEVADPRGLRKTLMKLHPWRKGPMNLGGLLIDTEWRSDWKWRRISNHLDLRGQTVLDVGCGNGYFGWRMLAEGARCVIGIDPTLVFVMQWLACRHFAGPVHNYVLPLGVEQLPGQPKAFDTVLSMGVLYHRKDPVAHLAHLAGLARPGGRVVLETLILEGAGCRELVPDRRYARMRNVWSVPTLEKLEQWLSAAHLPSYRVLDVTPTTTREQRSTEWMTFESLDRCLDPENPHLTVEGYPAPLRAMLLVDVSDQ